MANKRKKNSIKNQLLPNLPPQKPTNWKLLFSILGVMAFFMALYVSQPQQERNHATTSPIDLTPPTRIPDQYAKGKKTFQNNCSKCHGGWAQGTEQGPPLIHKIYEPSHHADMAFFQAVQFGVRAHHWPYGNMPPIPGVNKKSVDAIISFLRWWQRENGIR